MRYISIEHWDIERRMDIQGAPWQCRLVGRIIPDNIEVDLVTWNDGRSFPDRYLWPIPPVAPYRKMFARSPKGQYRPHRVYYPVVLAEGVLPPCLTK